MRVIEAEHAEARGVPDVFAEYTADDITVEPATQDAAIAHWGRLHPEVMWMDVLNRECSGIEATRRVTGANPRISVLVLTIHDNNDSVVAAVRAGAQVGLQTYGCLMGFCTAAQPKTRIFSELTDREREILALIAQGRRNEEIAVHLCLSIKTVRNHVSNIFSKLQVVDRTQAAIRAREAGFAWSG